MVEYHVDDCDYFHRIMERETIYGGRRSVRFTEDEQCTVIIGHDEAVIKQFLLTKKGWFGPNGEMGLVPKDEGHGLMLSGFVSRELGFGWEISEVQYREINRRREGQMYMDQEAAKKVKGNAAKEPLTKDPSIFEFEPGINAQGWWTYDHFVLQVENVCDVLRVLYPEFKFVFMVDHSCGHDRQREDGLNADNMNKSFGGKQSKLRDTIIKQKDGYLGPYPAILQPGDIQKMSFQPEDEGPFWMTTEERIKTRYDINQAGTKKRKFTKVELIAKLKDAGVTTKGKLKDLQTAARNLGIPIEELLQKVKEGWEGKPKGKLQVLWERGHIDNSNGLAYKKYTADGTKDEFGIIQVETSLNNIMVRCLDFEEEETMLLSMVCKMGFEVDRTPKCHAKMAGIRALNIFGL